MNSSYQMPSTRLDLARYQIVQIDELGAMWRQAPPVNSFYTICEWNTFSLWLGSMGFQDAGIRQAE